MINNSLYLDKFIQAIIDDGETAAHTMIQGVEAEHNRALSQAEDGCLEDAYRKIKAQSAAIRAQSGQRVSARTMELRSELNTERERIRREIGQRLMSMLEQYTLSPQYAEQLADMAARASELLGGGAVIVTLRPEDMELSGAILARLPAGSAIAAGVSGAGGIYVSDTDGRRTADLTYDTKLEQIRDRIDAVIDV